MLKARKNFTEGPLFFRITLFAIPIMLTGFLQIAYNMADNIVVGQFSGDPNALAAVGSCGSLNNLIINFLLGIGAGAGVVVAQFFGANEHEKVSGSVHTAMLIALFGGILFGAVGFLVSRPVLTLMGTKPEVLDAATLYIRIICIGIPANAIYNFGAAILRGTGNSSTPLIILGLSGLANVLLNLVFVIFLHMSVAGVATATIISQYISAIAILAVLFLSHGRSYQIKLSKFRIQRPYLLRILRFGVPTGLSSSMFGISNVFMTSAVNTFPTATVTANTIASQIDSVTLTSMSCFGQAAMTFSGQNYGARKPERILKSVGYSVIQTSIIGITVATLELVFARQLIGLFLDTSLPNSDAIVSDAITIMTLMLPSYAIFALMDSISGGIKGLGYSTTAMFINLGCICGIRVVWIFGIHPYIRTLQALFLSYPISWLCGLFAVLVCFSIVFVRFKKRLLRETEEAKEG
jgi:putative MATE family efflux protein